MAGVPEVLDPSELPARMRSTPALDRLVELTAGEDGLWLVGGAVRDLLLGVEPLDLDVLVEGDALDVAGRLARRVAGSVEATGRFDTATVLAPGVGFDLARARREHYPAPGALPEVEAAGIDEDLPRRDFTVNALAAALGREAPGELRAPEGALDDLRAGRLRVFHADSFTDDPTRLLRLARFGARLGFEVEAETVRLARQAVAAGALDSVSGKRIGTELRLLVGKAPASEALRSADELGLLAALHPGLRLDPAFTARALELIGGDEQRPLAALASVAGGLGREELRGLLDRLAFPATEREAIVAAAVDSPPLAASLASAERPSQIAAAAARRPAAQVALAGALGPTEPARRWLDELRHVAADVSGTDLVAAGVPEGPRVGRGLAAALAAKLDEGATREEQLAAALEAAAAPPG
jgi:tRNA nucleotidyltransferase (CCA-adding enzyme)